MKIIVLKSAATILAEKYEFHAADFVSKAIIDTETNQIEFLYTTTDYGTQGKHYVRIKDNDAMIVADAAYYEDGNLASKVI